MTNKKHTIKQLQGKKADVHPGSRRGPSFPSRSSCPPLRLSTSCTLVQLDN